MSTKTQHERITAEDVEVGDRIARTRNDAFHLVEQIDEAPATRRFHFAREDCTVSSAGLKTAADGRHFCPGCHRWQNTGPEERQIAHAGHGETGGGNIRPRRSAKLWRVVR